MDVREMDCEDDSWMAMLNLRGLLAKCYSQSVS
jgi:hypothetical protein